jgi:tRNA (adenine22-N1)-methyltransferase
VRRVVCYVAVMPQLPLWLFPTSARLDAILSLLLPCQKLADVGTDHGLLPVLAVRRGLAAHGIAADLRAPPLALARQNIARARLESQVTVLQGDGLRPLTGQAIDAVVMAGMSGALMVRLLQAVPEVTDTLSQLVLQPNQDIDCVRAWALERGLHLRAERMVEERGLFFSICAYRRGHGRDPLYTHDVWSVQELCLLGPLLLAQTQPATVRAWEQQRARLGKLVDQGVLSLAAEHAVWQRACMALRG